MGLASHDSNKQRFLICYFVFLFIHLLLNFLIISSSKKQQRLPFIFSFFEIVILYGLTLALRC